MGKSSKAPAPPDPLATANAQASANEKTAMTQARLNRINEYTPFGTVTYKGTGTEAAPYQRTISLDPAEQALLDSQRATELKLSDLGGTILDRVRPDLATPFSLDGLPAAPEANEENRKRVEEALYQRLAPQLQQDEEALRTRLANTGFDMNSEGYNRALDSQARARNDARLAITAAGGAEQSRLFGLEQAARQQAIQELALARSQPLNEISAILGTGQVQAPNFGGTPQVGVASPDLMGAVYNNYNAQVNQANQAAANKQAGLGSLFGLAGSVAGGLLSRPGGLF